MAKSVMLQLKFSWVSSLKLQLAVTWVGLELCLLAVIMPVGIVDAATPNPGVTVTPGQLNFVLSKDAPFEQQSVTLTNNYSVPVRFSAQFKGIDENAGLLTPTDTLDPSLAPALSISQTDITLSPQQAVVVTVQVNNIPSLEPGGSYATLELTQEPTSGLPTGALPLKAAASLSVFVVKVDGEKQDVTVNNPTTNGWLLKLPTTATITFSNKGNVHVVPRASVSIETKQTSLLAQGIGNMQSFPLLPGKQLTSAVQLRQIVGTWLPQKLSMITTYRPDGSSATKSSKTTFWYVPPVDLLVVPMLCAFVYLVRFAVRRIQSRQRFRKQKPVGVKKESLIAPTDVSNPKAKEPLRIDVTEAPSEEPAIKLSVSTESAEELSTPKPKS